MYICSKFNLLFFSDCNSNWWGCLQGWKRFDSNVRKSSRPLSSSMFARGLILKKAKKITYTYHIHRKKSFKNCTPNPLPPQKICAPHHYIYFIFFPIHLPPQDPFPNSSIQKIALFLESLQKLKYMDDIYYSILSELRTAYIPTTTYFILSHIRMTFPTFSANM